MIAQSDLWRYRGLIGTLAERELKLRYKRSFLGWLWSLINPASVLVIYTLVFGVFLRVPPPTGGNGELRSFALFLFCALVVWNFFSAVVPGCMAWLVGAGSLLTKVYFPPEAPLVAGTMSVLVQTGTELGILVIFMAAVGNIAAPALLLPYVLLLLVCFSLGVGLVVALLNVYFRDMNHIVPIGMTLLFYATPIVYPFNVIPETIWGGFPIQQLIRLNPLTQFVGTFRDILYDLRVPSLSRLAVLTLVSVGTFFVGYTIFRRWAPMLSEEL